MVGIPRTTSRRTMLAALALPVLAFGVAWAQRQVWTSESYGNPLSSPSGDLILVEATIPPHNREIFLVRADGTELRNLTQHPAEDIGARWSPDGRSILFKSDRDGEYGILRMNVDGSGVTKVASGVAGSGNSVGRQMVETPSMAATRAFGSPRPIAPSRRGSSRRKARIRSGRQMAAGSFYEKGGPGTRQIRLVAADGGVDRRITDGWAITWSPDSNAIFYLSYTSQVHPNLAHLCRINSDGSERVQLLDDVLAGANPIDPARLWSPMHSRLALRIGVTGGLWSREGVLVIDSDGGVVHDFRRREPFAYDETLSWRDGRTLVLAKLHLALRSGARLAKDPGGVYLLDIESGRERQIVRNKEILIDPRKPPW